MTINSDEDQQRQYQQLMARASSEDRELDRSASSHVDMIGRHMQLSPVELVRSIRLGAMCLKSMKSRAGCSLATA